jgi:hypothetical protein
MKINPFCLFLILIIFTVSFSWITSCKHNADISGLPEICFTANVLPVFTNNCTMSGCHDGQGESRLTLTSYAEIMKGVVPGKPYSSRVYKAIIGSGGENSMPPGRPLLLESRTFIRVWIEQGASLTTCADSSGGGVAKMPPSGSLSACRIRQFESWISNGYPDN